MLPVLRHVHLQLTKRCNLRCYFCGQWGEKGYLRHHPDQLVEADLAEWQRIIAQVAELQPRPKLTIWGGEPFMHPDCSAILAELRERGFKIDLVTNGVLIAPQIDTINRCVNTLFVSIDGPREVHERIRGVPGIFDTILANFAQVDATRVNKIAMTVINEHNYRLLPDLPKVLEPAGLSTILLQNLIYMTPEDGARYRTWLNEAFACAAPGAEAWIQPQLGDYINELPAMVREIERRSAAGEYRQKVVLFPDMSGNRAIDYYRLPDGLPSGKTQDDYCWAPFTHVNIDPSGEVQPCIDFHDLSLGNIRRQTLAEIFAGERAEHFRQEIVAGHNPACKHCPWRFNTHLLNE